MADYAKAAIIIWNFCENGSNLNERRFDFSFVSVCSEALTAMQSENPHAKNFFGIILFPLGCI